MKPVIKLVWHEPSNFMGTFEIRNGGLPLITIVDEDFRGINPFYSYPLSFLGHWGWIVVGEL